MADRMHAGRLYQAVAFDKPVQQSDGQGGTINGWEQQFECRAHYRYLRGGESVQAARLEGRQPLIITVRSSSETQQVQTDWRIRDVRTGEFDVNGDWTGVVYQIKAVNPTDDRRFLEILAESGVAG